MSTTSRLIRVVLAALAVVLLGLAAWFLLVDPNAGTASADRALAEVASEPTTAPTAVPTATPRPSATPQPTATPTPVPTPLPFEQALPLGPVNELLATPLPDCGLLRDEQVTAGTITLTCLGDDPSVPVVAAAPGRVVHIMTEAAKQDSETADNDPTPTWSWEQQQHLGPVVVVDHGPLGTSTNAQTVYAGLDSIEETLQIGTVVEAGTTLGAVQGPSASLLFSVWTDDTRQDGVRVLAAGPPAEDQRGAAAALAPVLGSPTDAQCPLVRAASQLPGAPRAYRNGTHRGIDFGCGAADRSAFAVADGTVVYVVKDYQDPTVADREALLAQAGIAGFTPHWTLVMLYGNVVVVDHGDIPGAGRVVTITAHLEAVDPAITLGDTVEQGQRLGELGNRGTNASAQGLRGAADPSLHLHWELFVDNWYLGDGLDAATINELVTTALCGAAQTPGCPAS